MTRHNAAISALAISTLLTLSACTPNSASAPDPNSPSNAALSEAQQVWPKHLPKILQPSFEHYLPDFSYAGYGFGIEDIPAAEGQVFDVTAYGALANDGLDDSVAILKAVEDAHAHNGPVIINFPAGKFILTEIININRSDIVIRGAGRSQGGTELYIPRPLRMVGDGGKLDELRQYIVELNKRERKPKKNLDVYFSEYSWSGGFIWIGTEDSRPAPYLEAFDPEPAPEAKALTGQRGGLELTISEDEAATLTAGQWIQISWYSRNGPEGEIINALYGDTDVDVGSHHWSFKNRPLVAQKTKITSIDGETVTIANPLLHDISESLPADIDIWQPLENVGIEDIKIAFPNAVHFGHHTEEGYNGIYFTGSANGWVRNVTTDNADSGILTYSSANLTLRDIRTEGERNAHYGVHLGNVHNVLVERLEVFNPALHSLTFNTQATRNVYKDCRVYTAPALDQHAGANHQNLFDNTTVYIQANREDGNPVYPLFDGSGAGYWQPGHGGFNTAWNLNVIVETGASAGETVTIQGLAEGPDARIIGLTGNRDFALDYRPAPYSDFINKPMSAAPSLYAYQRQKRLSD